MDRKIVLYGHKQEKDVFETPADFIDYIARGVFEDNEDRYRYSQRKQADVIVLSLAGTIYGHFETDPEVLTPTTEDIEDWGVSVGVYIVRKSVVYNNRVSLAELGITGIQFGKRLSESEFADIQGRATGVRV